jgi:hypothetical protein
MVVPARQATDDNIIRRVRFACCVTGYRHILRLCYNYCFHTAKTVKRTRLIVALHAHFMSCYLVCWKQNYEMEQCWQVSTYHKLTATQSPGAFRGAADGVTRTWLVSPVIYAVYTWRFPRTSSTYTDSSFQYVTITSFPHILIASSTRMYLSRFRKRKGL